MAELANQTTLDVPSATKPVRTSPKLVPNGKRHLFKRRDTPMTLDVSGLKGTKFSPKFEDNFEEEPTKDEQSKSKATS